MDNLAKWIERELPKYHRWVADGRKWYGYTDRQQLYYDCYHTSIEKNDDDTFRYRFQIYDSPEGDTWAIGNFRIRVDGSVEILSTETERC